jgi:hypothetical protein
MQLPNQIVNYLSGIFYSFDKISCTNLAKFFENLAHDSFNRCLSGRFSWESILFSVALRLFKPKGGNLIIDEVIIPKPYGKKLEGLHIFKCPITQKYYPSYKVIVMCWSNGKDIRIPLAFRIWQKKEGKTALELAIELLQFARGHRIVPDYVLFDSYYASKKILNTIHSWGWKYCTQIKKNRFFNGTRIERISFRPYWTAIGKLKGCESEVVVAKHGHKYFCSNDLTLGHQTILKLYKKRWPIETIFRFSKQKLGLSECQCRSLTAQKAHVTMCFLAYLIIQKESILRNLTIYQIKSELSFQRAKFNLYSFDLLTS